MLKEYEIDLKESLGDRIKKCEKKFQTFIPKNEHIIVRLDGHGFSKYTRGFKKPFDKIFVETMIKVSEKLYDEFKPSFVYTQSDEITMVIPSKELNQNIYNGKVQKIVSLTASYATAMFNSILKEEILKELKKTIKSEKEKIKYLNLLLNKKMGKATFDSRIFSFESKTEVFNTVLWRMRDAERNSISMFASNFYSTKELNKKVSSVKKEMLLSVGVDWEKEDNSIKYGTCIKKEIYEKSVGVFRKRFKRITEKLYYSEENVELIFSPTF